MAGITLAQAETQLQAWIDASTAVSGGQSYTIKTANGLERSLTRADAASIRENISFWDRQCKELEAGRPMRARRGVPI
jgi:hypothetical protein